jgi:hypothetical protein
MNRLLMPPSPLSPVGVLLLLALFQLPASGQILGDYKEFYRTMHLDARERIVFCNPTTTPEREPAAIGVRRDSLGRPVEVMRFFFGNPEGKGDFQAIRFTYFRNDSTGVVRETRSYIGPGGFPTPIGAAYGEEVLFRRDGMPFLRRLVDIQGRELSDVPTVTSSRFHEEKPGVVVQEWFFGRGKQHYGTNTDGLLRRFGPVTEGAYFRRFTVDDNGFLEREELESLVKEPFAFPGGELVRVYENNDCGEPVSITYLDHDGRPMANRAGIARETFAYDEFGHLVEWRGYDVDGDPHGRQPDGAAAVVFKYRAHDGALLGQDRYDVKGKLIEE